MNTDIDILDHGEPLRLGYDSLLEYHGRAALAGAAIGFRAMACAGAALSGTRIWDRKDLSVVSWHGGPGVRDAIEFITRVITRGHFELRKADDTPSCATVTAFRFEVGDGARVAQITLREDVVAPPFFQLARTAGRNAQQEAELSRLKTEVACSVMQLPLHQLFELRIREPSHA